MANTSPRLYNFTTSDILGLEKFSEFGRLRVEWRLIS